MDFLKHSAWNVSTLIQIVLISTYTSQTLSFVLTPSSTGLGPDPNTETPKYLQPRKEPSKKYGTPSEFVKYLDQIHDLAVAYGDGTTANLRVMEWLRHEEYNTFPWQELVGTIDDNWIKYVRKRHITMFDYVKDPAHNIYLKVSHLAATMNGVFVHGNPDGDLFNRGIIPFNRGDITGWGGDWITFYRDWQLETAKNKATTGEKYCHDFLANFQHKGSFKIRDLIEDVDGYYIGMSLRREPGRTIAELVKDFYKPRGGYTRRFTRFLKDRFQGSVELVAITAQDFLLVPGNDLVLRTAKDALISMGYGGGHKVIAPQEVAKVMPGDFYYFCQCYAERFLIFVITGLLSFRGCAGQVRS